MGVSSPSNLRMFTPEPPSPEVRQALTRLTRAEDVTDVAAMPDVHLAQDVCVGAVVATQSLLYPAAVGGDIGCGMAACPLSGAADLHDPDRVKAVFQGLGQAVPILRHPTPRALPDAVAEPPISPQLAKTRDRLAARQLGTLGRGNHFLEVQSDEDDGLWLMVHTGSRGMGQAIREAHLKQAVRRKGGLLGLDAHTEAGQAYLTDVAWALTYAQVSRQQILAAAGQVLFDVFGVEVDLARRIDVHHNHVRQETLGSDPRWVHRKGATSARAGEPGIIPGSMGTESFHVVGKGHAGSLYSSSHGAGRTLPRGLARRKISVDDLKAQMTGIWFDARLAPRLTDEAPAAYKDIGRVMRAQRDLTQIVRRLRPRLVYKGG